MTGDLCSKRSCVVLANKYDNGFHTQ